MKKLEKITKNQIIEKGVQSLADRPNASAQYGVGNLSPQQLKLWFDKLATFLAEKINESFDAISSNDAADYIRIVLDDYDVESLQDLINAMVSGDFADRILQVLPSPGATERITLQSFIYGTVLSIGKHAEDIEKLQDDLNVLVGGGSGEGGGQGGGGAVDIVQTTGDREDAVMSQKAVTEALENAGGGIDLSDYVKKTDYASEGEAGVVKVGTLGAEGVVLNEANRRLQLYWARKNYLDTQSSYCQPLTPVNMAYAVKQSLINPNLSPYLKANWTAEEQAAARATLGISGGGGTGGTGLYLHTIAFNQSISSPEGEPFDKVYLFVVTTNATAAVIDTRAAYGSCGNLYLRFEPSQILAAYGGWILSGHSSYYLPVEIVVSKIPTNSDVYDVPSTTIEHARILSFTPNSSWYEGVSTPEVLLDPDKFEGDTVTAL